MRKIRLDLGALAVESFTAGGGEGDGTVEGCESTTDCGVTVSGDAFCAEDTRNCPNTCSCNANTCYDTCFQTCKYTCVVHTGCEQSCWDCSDPCQMTVPTC